MALRSLGSGADRISTGGTANRPTDIDKLKGYIRYTTQEQHFDGWSPYHQLWKLIKYVPDEENINDLIVDSSVDKYNAGVYVCQDFKVLSGVTMNFDTQGVVVVALGDVEIDGIINATNKGCLGASSAGSKKIDQTSGLGQGAGAGDRVSNPYSAMAALTGSGGGRGGGVTAKAGEGGRGGGGIVIKSYGNITINNTGGLYCNGGTGGSGSYSSGNSSDYACGGSGGGSGGVIVLDAAGDIWIKPSAIIQANGGSGGSGRSAGSSGSASGGGGGGGGDVVIQAGGIRKIENNPQVAGGNPGSSSGSTYSGGAGGSCAGRGGGSRGAGQQGEVREFGSPFSI